MEQMYCATKQCDDVKVQVSQLDADGVYDLNVDLFLSMLESIISGLKYHSNERSSAKPFPQQPDVPLAQLAGTKCDQMTASP